MNALARALGALLLVGGAAHASIPLTATLTNDQETHPVDPTTTTGDPRPISFGSVTFLIDDAMSSMSFEAIVHNIDFTGLQTADTNDNLMAAHIHASPTAVPGVNGGVVWGFFGAPFNDTAPPDVVVTPFLNGVGGTITGTWNLTEGNNTDFTAQLPNILGGTSYMNFHTMQFGAGEVRGQIVVVPEPETYALLLAGLGVLGVVARRRRQKDR